MENINIMSLKEITTISEEDGRKVVVFPEEGEVVVATLDNEETYSIEEYLGLE